MSPVPAACVMKGHSVLVEEGTDGEEIIAVTAVHNSTPEPGKITWDIVGGTYVVGAATDVTILNPTPIKEPRSR